MAELDVQPKKGNPWWLWLLIALVVLGLLFFLMRGCNDDRPENAAVNTEEPVTRSNTSSNEGWGDLGAGAVATRYDEITDQGIEVRENEDYAVYGIGETVLFDVDQSTLRSGAEQTLEQVAQSVKNRYADAEMRIIGHTDGTASASHNMQLGQERAEAVRNWLVQNGGLQQDRLSVHSEGQTDPVATNTTADGRQQNRRVEIVVRR